MLEDTVQTLKDKIKPFTIAKLSDGTVGIFLPNHKEELVLYSNKYECIASLDSFDDNLKDTSHTGIDIIAIKNTIFPINALCNVYRSNEEIEWDWKRKAERTEEEKKIIGIALQLGLKYVTRDYDGQLIFWEKRPCIVEECGFWINEETEASLLSIKREDIFKEVVFEAGVFLLEEFTD